jgi:hypothetical protein
MEHGGDFVDFSWEKSGGLAVDHNSPPFTPYFTFLTALYGSLSPQRIMQHFLAYGGAYELFNGPGELKQVLKSVSVFPSSLQGPNCLVGHFDLVII